MSDTTARLGLPLIAAGQAQKELFHNEALVLLEAAALATIEEAALDAPPADPVAGRCWIVGVDPVEAWVGRGGQIAIATEGGWRFVAPVSGMTVRRAEDGLEFRYDGAAWRRGETVAERVVIGGRQVVGLQQPAVEAPFGGGTVDAEARAAITAVLAALQAHGLVAM
jgi:hypothetical protein